MRPSVRRAIRRWVIGIAVGVPVFVLLCNRWVINSTDAYIYREVSLMPANEFGLVLGTSKYLESGKPSPEFRGRIETAAELYRAGKVSRLIVSGANPDSTYNEPRAMARELIKLGVPEDRITMDFAGFRTFDSIVRAQAVFGLQQFTVVTQRYHSYRAVFLGRKMGMKVVAMLAPARSDGGMGNRNPPREVFARVNAVLDVFVLGTQPKFLGERQQIPLTPEAEGT
jgi:SanA protein